MDESEASRAARVAQLREVLPHIAATIAFVAPEIDLSGIKPIRPSRRHEGTPAQGIIGSALHVLRDSNEALTIAEIVTEIALRNNLDVSTVAKRQRYHTAVNNGLKRPAYAADVEIIRGRPDRFRLRSG